MQRNLVAPRVVVLMSITSMQQQQLREWKEASDDFSWCFQNRLIFDAEAAQTTASIDFMGSLMKERK